MTLTFLEARTSFDTLLNLFTDIDNWCKSTNISTSFQSAKNFFSFTPLSGLIRLSGTFSKGEGK